MFARDRVLGNIGAPMDPGQWDGMFEDEEGEDGGSCGEEEVHEDAVGR